MLRTSYSKTQLPPTIVTPHAAPPFTLHGMCFSAFTIHPNPIILWRIVTETQMGSYIKSYFLKHNIREKKKKQNNNQQWILSLKLQTYKRSTVIKGKIQAAKPQLCNYMATNPRQVTHLLCTSSYIKKKKRSSFLARVPGIPAQYLGEDYAQHATLVTTAPLLPKRGFPGLQQLIVRHPDPHPSLAPC